MVTLSTETTVNAVNPEIVNQIAAVYVEVANSTEVEVELADLLYRCVQSVLRQTAHADIDATFVYYLHSYRTLMAAVKPELAEDPKVFSHAALALFEVYKNTRKTHTPALLLRRAVKALTQVVTEIVGHSKEVDQLNAVDFTTSLAIVAQTIDYYTAPVRITRHEEYLNWLRSFYTACLVQPFDVTLIGNTTLTKVSQLARRRQKIFLTPL